MKLLFDENLSYKLVSLIKEVFPDSDHVSLLNLQQAKDYQIWKYAKKNSFVVVTKDSDFFDFSQLMGPNPKIIWLKYGNVSTQNIADALIQQKNNIITALSNSSVFCLELYIK